VNPLEVKEYLKKLNDKGFIAYITGGYVRDYLLGKKSTDIDIITNAHPNEVKKIFNLSTNDLFGSINIKDGNLNIDITTFRKETRYLKHQPQSVSYISDLKDDLLRRDFTINAICMDKDGKIIDILKGIDDLQKRKIRVIGNIKEKYEEDPLRMLRALRMSIVLDLIIDENEFKYILNNKHLFDNISFERKKIELEKILSCKNAIKGLEFLKTNGFEETLNIRIPNSLKYSDRIPGMWAQLDFDSRFHFSKIEKKSIDNIREILKNKKIDEHDILKYGFENTNIASWILGLEEKCFSLYVEMPIHTYDELNINGDDIKTILNLESSIEIRDIKNDIIDKILLKKLNNDRNEIIDYIKKHWK